ncbi:hypothetical protein, partial [Burkholderia sp. BCC1977]|uniref:hypothetical protein n=1 Tax=Burkholderia sp. BCC1977 TaxID=2817440 RepID=UPI002ABD4DB0
MNAQSGNSLVLFRQQFLARRIDRTRQTDTTHPARASFSHPAQKIAQKSVDTPFSHAIIAFFRD